MLLYDYWCKYLYSLACISSKFNHYLMQRISKGYNSWRDMSSYHWEISLDMLCRIWRRYCMSFVDHVKSNGRRMREVDNIIHLAFGTCKMREMCGAWTPSGMILPQLAFRPSPTEKKKNHTLSIYSSVKSFIKKITRRYISVHNIS